MAELVIDQVLDLGDDRLEIRGHWAELVDDDGAPIPLTAYGWRSALEAHPVDDTRDEAGHRHSDDRRPMTAEERLAYCKAQLAEQNADVLNRPAEPVDLGIVG